MSEVQVTHADADLDDLPQIQLPLTKPFNYGKSSLLNSLLLVLFIFGFPDSDVMMALNSRNLDTMAKKFLQSERRKV